MGQVVPFPIKHTRIAQWYTHADQVYRDTNIIGTRVWATKNVPLPFREMIVQSVLHNTKRNNNNNEDT